ncbi:MAG: hypothetical protein K6A23_06150 [Butyrivibrio sp.]|nr:hypothetical protein [Butyrivibrio sp.]
MEPVSLSFLSVLEDLLSDLINEILLPVLLIAFDYLWEVVTGMINAYLCHLLFDLYVLLLKILLILERIFDVFSCNTGVYTMQNGQMIATSGYVDVTKNYSLLDVLMQNELIINAALGMTAGAFVLCFIITIFSVVKSMGEGIGELKRPVSHILRQTSKACLTFVLIPIVCILVIRLSGLVISSINMYMPNNIEGSSKIDAAQLVSEALSNNTAKPARGSQQSKIEKALAVTKIPTPNADTRACDLIFYLTVKDALRNRNNEAYYLSGQHFQNKKAAFEDISVVDINWLYAFFEVGLVLIIFLKLILECMTRVFMILILFVVSPYFVAMMPMDDGAKFKKWKEMFLGFTVSVFGPILAMKLYLVLLPYIVTSSNLDLGFAVDAYSNMDAAIASFVTGQSVEAVGITTNLFRLFFIAAGGFAVYKSQYLMLDIINPEVTRFLGASSGSVERMLGGATAKAKNFALSKINSFGKQGGNSESGEGGSGASGNGVSGNSGQGGSQNGGGSQ